MLSGTLRESAAFDPTERFRQSIITADLFDLICAEKLGEGIDRCVFAHGLDDGLVVKFETCASGRFQNVAEWLLWQHAEAEQVVGRTVLSDWLAPCHSISPNGVVLIQSRTTPAELGDMPAKAPTWLGDYKLSNYGLLNGRVVAHDYGLPIPQYPDRMRRAEWRTT